MTSKARAKKKPAKDAPTPPNGAVAVRCSFATMLPTDELHEHPCNPNRHSKRQIAMLARIIQHQGWRAPIVVSKLSNFVVCGHARLSAARSLQLPKVPVDYQEFTSEADEIAHLVADNKSAELAKIDNDMMDAILEELSESFDRELLGIVSKENGQADDLDVSNLDDLEERHQVIVDCRNEAEQKKIFTRLKAENFSCRVLTF